MKTTNYKKKKIIEKYSKKTLAAIHINYPAFLKLLRGIRGKEILDIGCGAGWLAGKLVERGARVSAVDSSPKWIEICKQNSGLKKIAFSIADAADLGIFKAESFDIVIANMVFLCASSGPQIEKMFREAGRVLRRGGSFIFSDCHPVTNLTGSTGTKVSKPPRGFCYFKEGAKYKATYLLSDYSRIEFIDAHWSLGFYSRLLKKNGMMLEEILEPRPVSMDPRKRFGNYNIPEYIIWKCRKF